jgi:hypothetical protein
MKALLAIFLGSFFDLKDGGDVTLSLVYGVISQKIEHCRTLNDLLFQQSN